MSNKLKNMRAVLLMIFAAVSLSVSAQTVTLTGNVKDTTGESVIGASVTEKGKNNNGTITDLDGNFTLRVSPNATVVISYIGMKTHEVALKGQTKIDVTLLDDAKTLDEVVVIGYGTVKKKDLTGSVSSVGGDMLAKVPVASTAQALTGRLAGVQITTADGSPDAEMIIRVRGGGSITGDNSPLYIVDGFPVKSINDIAAADIQTIDVLKDASSTAIYGSQGANGVVMITTKSAKSGKTQVSFNSYMQSKKLARRLDVLDPYEFALFNYERAALDGESALNSFEKNYGYFWDLDLYKYQKATDWQDDMFGSSVISQQYNVSITGGSDKTKFSLSATYNKDGGLMVNNDYSRLNLNFKLNHQIAKGLTLDFITRVTDTETNGSGTSGGTYKIRSSQAVTSSPVKGLSDYTIVDPSTMTEEEYEEYLRGQLTLTEQAQQYWKRKNTNVFHYTAALNWDIIKNLTYRVEGGYEYNFSQQKNYWGPRTSQSSNEGQNLPLVDWTKTNAWNYRIANTLTYRFTLAKKHQFDMMVGQEVKSGGSEQNYMKAKYFSEDLTPEKIFANIGLSSGTNNLSATSKVNPHENMASFFGRFNYRFAERYLLTLTFRTDGSSKFGKGNRWGYFPAAALAWRINEETFMAGTHDWLSNLKLRFSYGEAGNDRIYNTMYKLDYSINSTTKPYGAGEIVNPYYAPTNTQLANPYLQWESMVTRNMGLDFGFLNEKISGTLDLYNNKTKKLLLQSPIVAPGYQTQQRNVGQTSNKGIELTLNAFLIEKKNVSLSATFNMGINKSNVDRLEDGVSVMSANSGWAGTDLKGQDDYRVMVGEPVGLIYGFVTDGYYTTDDFVGYDSQAKKWILKDGVTPNGYVTMRPGALKLKDLDENGKIDEEDRQIIGRTAPKHTGGFGFNGLFHGFDASIYFNWVYGNKIYNADKIASTQQYRSSYPNLLEYMNSSNRYTYLDSEGHVITDMAVLKEMNEGANAKQYWSPHNFGNAVVIPHSWAVEDGSFLRLQNITVGYTLPKTITKRFGCNQFRLYCTLNNVYVWTKYTGYDPEVSSPARSNSTSGLTPGVDYSAYPKSFSYTFGVNLTF